SDGDPALFVPVVRAVARSHRHRSAGRAGRRVARDLRRAFDGDVGRRAGCRPRGARGGRGALATLALARERRGARRTAPARRAATARRGACAPGPGAGTRHRHPSGLRPRAAHRLDGRRPGRPHVTGRRGTRTGSVSQEGTAGMTAAPIRMLDDARLRPAAARLRPDADPYEVIARVAWSVLVEPGDGVAGTL